MLGLVCPSDKLEPVVAAAIAHKTTFGPATGSYAFCMGEYDAGIQRAKKVGTPTAVATGGVFHYGDDGVTEPPSPIRTESQKASPQELQAHDKTPK